MSFLSIQSANRCHACGYSQLFHECIECTHVRTHGIDPILVYEDWLFIGNLFSTTSNALVQHNITHVVSLFKTKFERPDNVSFLDIQITDAPHIGINDTIEQSMAFIKASRDVNPNARVLVHCYMGVSRSSSIIIAFLITQGMSFEEAFKSLTNVHPRADPNVGFVRQLEKFAVRCKEC